LREPHRDSAGSGRPMLNRHADRMRGNLPFRYKRNVYYQIYA
jgi:hypothetical protein